MNTPHQEPQPPADDDEQTLSEQIGESMRSEDEPLGETKPSAPFALVMGSYPIILILLLLSIAAYFFWFRADRETDVDGTGVPPAAVQSMDQPANSASP